MRLRSFIVAITMVTFQFTACESPKTDEASNASVVIYPINPSPPPMPSVPPISLSIHSPQNNSLIVIPPAIPYINVEVHHPGDKGALPCSWGGSPIIPGQYVSVIVDAGRSSQGSDPDANVVKFDSLSYGSHLIRSFIRRPNCGESVKESSYLQAISIGIKPDARSPNPPMIDINQPMIAYNLPSPSVEPIDSSEVVLDFVLWNVPRVSSGPSKKIRIILQRPNVIQPDTLSVYPIPPFRISGLLSGLHSIQLQLLNYDNSIVMNRCASTPVEFFTVR